MEKKERNGETLKQSKLIYFLNEWYTEITKCKYDSELLDYYLEESYNRFAEKEKSKDRIDIKNDGGYMLVPNFSVVSDYEDKFDVVCMLIAYKIYGVTKSSKYGHYMRMTSLQKTIDIKDEILANIILKKGKPYFLELKRIVKKNCKSKTEYVVEFNWEEFSNKFDEASIEIEDVNEIEDINLDEIEL